MELTKSPFLGHHSAPPRFVTYDPHVYYSQETRPQLFLRTHHTTSKQHVCPTCASWFLPIEHLNTNYQCLELLYKLFRVLRHSKRDTCGACVLANAIVMGNMLRQTQ